MYVSVDIDEGAVEGFKYTNEDGEDEFVNIESNHVEIIVHGQYIAISYNDIPKLIKALQAACAYKRGV